VVVSIIGLLAGLGFPAINGAMKAGKKAEVAAMAESIKTAVNAFYAEYSSYPTNLTTFKTDKDFLEMMCTTNGTGANIRGIIFLEVPPKFTNSDGIVTPQGFDKTRGRLPFYVAIDQSNIGYVVPSDAKTLGSKVTTANVPSSVAVWADDADVSGKAVGTFK